MQRLVYAPKIQAWIRSDGGVVDLSPYITGCQVQRKINQVSSATVRFRNPRKMFTNWADKDGYVGPVFHPMDPIIITMTRLRGRPIQVFTGYCDTTPYFSMYPGEVSLDASCTLKRLQYSFWDPGLPFVWKFLQDYGWQIDSGRGGIMNATAEGEDLKTVNKFNDGSIANLLLGVLRDVGGWDESTVFIEKLPDTIGPLVTKLFNETKDDRDKSKEGLTDFLTQIIGTGSLGTSSTGDGSSSSASVPTSGVLTFKQIGMVAYAAGFRGHDLCTAIAITVPESSRNTSIGRNSSGHCGLWQITEGDSGFNASQLNDPNNNAKAAYALYKGRGGAGVSYATRWADWLPYSGPYADSPGSEACKAASWVEANPPQSRSVPTTTH